VLTIWIMMVTSCKGTGILHAEPFTNFPS